MSILTTLGQYIPGSENYGQHEKNIAPALIAAIPGLVQAGTSLIGADSRKRELSAARVEQNERQYDYENFDYNQDVGAINNPYAELVNKQQEFSQRNIDQSQANQLGLQQQSGAFGATGSILAAQNKATEAASRKITSLRGEGATYVEKQRQSRIQDKFTQAGTFLGRADERLAGAKRAKARANEQLIKGITGAATSAATSGLSGAGGTEAGKIAKDSGSSSDIFSNKYNVDQSIAAGHLEEFQQNPGSDFGWVDLDEDDY